MHSLIRHRFALLLAGLGLSTTIALAEPAKTSKPADSKSAKVAKVDPPKADPKPPISVPKFEPKAPIVLPKAGPKLDPKPVVALKPKIEPKPLPKPDPKPPVKVVPIVPDVKLAVKPATRLPIVHEKPKIGGPKELPKGPGLKLPGGTKVDHAELAKMKPPIDLTKTKPETILAAKPPMDFKVKPIGLDKIHVPADAKTVTTLNFTTVNKNQTFVLNQNFYTGGNYHTKFGTKMAFGYCYAGQHHSHWHHSIWDPCFGCNYYFCPSASCYYYWCGADHCYYPCHWFVDYGTCYYPWWVCGGFGGYGYVGTPHVSIFIGW
jgi:hypothetical protein